MCRFYHNNFPGFSYYSREVNLGKNGGGQKISIRIHQKFCCHELKNTTQRQESFTYDVVSSGIVKKTRMHRPLADELTYFLTLESAPNQNLSSEKICDPQTMALKGLVWETTTTTRKILSF